MIRIICLKVGFLCFVHNKVEMKRLKDEIKEKNEQIDLLEKQMSNYFIPSDNTEQSGVSQVCSLHIIVAFFHLFIV